MPAAIVLGTSTFTMSALPGTPAIQNAIPMPFFGTTPFAAPGLGLIAVGDHARFRHVVARARWAAARRAGEGYGGDVASRPSGAETSWCASARRRRANSIRRRSIAVFEAPRCRRSALAALPLIVVVGVNLHHVADRSAALDTSFLAGTPGVRPHCICRRRLVRRHRALCGDLVADPDQPPSAAGPAREHGCWSQCFCSAGLQRRKSRGLRRRSGGAAGLCDGARWVLSIGGGPLVSLAVATNIFRLLRARRPVG